MSTGEIDTKKLTGLQINLPDNQEYGNKLIQYVPSACTFNYLPVNNVEIEENVTDKDKKLLYRNVILRLFTLSSPIPASQLFRKKLV